MWFDRSPAETRHVGVSQEWDKLEFVLREGQVRLEKFQRLNGRVPPKIRKIIREHLSTVHSGLANCHLETGEYGKAREEMSRAVRLDPTRNIAAKWVLTWVSPSWALRAVRRRQETKTHSLPQL